MVFWFVTILSSIWFQSGFEFSLHITKEYYFRIAFDFAPSSVHSVVDSSLANAHVQTALTSDTCICIHVCIYLGVLIRFSYFTERDYSSTLFTLYTLNNQPSYDRT